MRVSSYRINVGSTLVLVLWLLSAATVTPSTSASTDPLTIAGRVDVRPEVTPYIVVRVVNDATGVVLRSAPLDATRTFSFANIGVSAVSVEAAVELPDHLYTLDAASSVLKSTVVPSSSTSSVQLTIVALSKTDAVSRVSAAPATTGSSVVSAVLALLTMVAAWYGRHKIVSLLDMPAFKPPKQRKVMVGM
ncbi:hypothetical protein NESM_000049600 [Novymonas esmeraldas]|uniref:Uncharacterized protein n=1 Tax=Novymonas esmeraldas TaxID=1808958 RepID=A0AAW0F0S5_9TRYP